MDNFTNLIAYFRDMATRHPDILHTAAKPRFFFLEWDTMVESGQKLAATGYTLVVEDFKEQLKVDGGEHETVVQSVALMVLRHAKPGNQADVMEAYTDSRRICRSLLAKMRREHFNNCAPDVPAGITVPEWVDLNSATITAVKPPFFDNAYGMRMVVQCRTRDEGLLTEDDTEWVELP